MKLTDFENNINIFILELKKSKLYTEYKKIDNEILNNEKLKELSTKRDKLYEQYSSDLNNTSLLIDAKKLHDEINSFKIVKKYYIYQKKIKKILSIIDNNIIKEVKND